VNPLLVVISLFTASLGVAGLAYETRRHRRAPRQDPQPTDESSSTSAVTG
jgi:hypothetical protein